MRLFLLQPEVIFSARVNQATFTYPLDEVTYDGAYFGNYLDIKTGQTILFGTTAGGDDLGRQRVRAGALATKIFVGLSSQGTRDGELNLADNAYITVLNDFRVWAKIPYITEDGTIYKDAGLGVYGQTDDIPPKANGGAGMAGDVDGTGYLTVDFSAAESYALSGSIASVTWQVDDGTIITGTSTSTTMTCKFPPGFRWVGLTVSNTGGKIHTTWIPVFARNPAADATINAFEIVNHQITAAGQRLSLRILEPIPEGTYPDGTLVMLWEGNPDESAGHGDRSHMRFIGWHHTDPAHVAAGPTGILAETVLDCLDVAGKLDTLPGFPISVEGNDSPTTWLQMSSPNMDKYLDYILRWHSSAFEVAHCTLSGTGSDYPFVILGSDAATLWQQASRRAQSLVPDYVLTCDTKGRLAVKPDPLIQETAGRTSASIDLDEKAWTEINYTTQRQPRIYWLRSEAVLASATEISALFSVAPGDSPGQGESEQTHGEQLAISQAGLNAAEGNRYARLNARQSYFTIVPATFDDIAAVEPANMTWLTLTMSDATAAKRGAPFTTARGLVHEINISYRHERTGMVRDVTLTWERETSGDAAATFTPPDPVDPPIYEPDPGDGYEPAPIGLGDGFGTVYVLLADTLYRTRDFSASSPVWVDVGPSGVTGMNDFILDPYNPRENGFILCDDGVYKSSDLSASAPTWTQKISKSEIEAMVTEISTSAGSLYKIVGSINSEGFFAFLGSWTRQTINHSGGCFLCKTGDGGDTWSYSIVQAEVFGNGLRGLQVGGLDIVPHVVDGWLVLYAATGNSAINAYALLKSTDSGDTWSTVVSVAQATGSPRGGALVHCPYSGNEDGLLVYWGVSAANGYPYLWKFNGSANSDISRSYAFPAAGDIKRWMAETATLDEDSLYQWEPFNAGSLWLSSNGGASWTEVSSPTGIDTSGKTYASGGFPTNDSQFYLVRSNGTAVGVYVSTDRGASWTDKTGNISELSSSADQSRTVIVPVWVIE